MPETTQQPSRAEIEAADKAYHAAIASDKLWDPPITAALLAAAKVRAREAGQVVVTDEMVERACDAYNGATAGDELAPAFLMRAALEAVLR